MTVTKEQAMAMFSHDLDMFMNDMRGLLAHYRIADWEAYLFFRKPDCAQGYVLKYEANSGDGFAQRIVALHASAATAKSQTCVKCGHLKLEPWRGYCKHEASAFGKRPVTYCGCKCEFTTPIAGTDDNEEWIE